MHFLPILSTENYRLDLYLHSFLGENCNKESNLRQEATCSYRTGWFLYIASPQHGDLRLSSPPSGQGVSGGARIRDRRVPADLRADSQAAVPPTPLTEKEPQ
ncbi:hypothetical protein PoB_007042300 [Plakobranchus ocellatus]|uniref:Uncharacterized protein n=1 Tax=Plakobranchus ocellatus TaxID=259542 RepID=A0AAV4DI74_9GAST|nr:hypothetical protein PoB_007042300 [Plakobranchus ocellatus]